MKKQINFRTVHFLMAMFLFAGSVFFASCSKDTTTTVTLQKTVLTDSINTALALYNGSVEGTVTGDYLKGSRETLDTIIIAVQAILSNTASTQANINAAVVQIANAMATFRVATVQPIAASSLVAQWTFSEGSGITVHDASTNQLTGTLMAGHTGTPGAVAGILPTWTKDRYGVANQALHFGSGGHIEVPFNSVLNPSAITICCWVKSDSTYANDYIISQNWWVGYKFQLQSSRRPFFSVTTTTAEYDRDWNVNGVDTLLWHHFVVTYDNGVETFYGDGQLVYSWTNLAGPIATIAVPESFCIGQAEPNNPKVSAANDPAQWGVGYFIGSIDEIRIYNVALTASQVSAIYTLEKP